ncbi:MAG: hypothetical protein ACHQD9_08335, partial [Chitinophagales bacterium]
MKLSIRFAAIITSAFIVLQSISFLIIETQYNLNHTYIASVLCENRDKPQLHCDGKCYLKKEMTHQQDQQSNSQKTSQQLLTLSLFWEESSDYHFFHPQLHSLFAPGNIFFSSGFV